MRSALEHAAKGIVPPRLRPAVAGAVRPLAYRGRRVVCPCCDRSFDRFRAHRARPQAKCPRCGSLERHRLLWLYLERTTDLRSAPLSVLHFAPEYFVQRRFRALPNLRYVSADIDSPIAMDRVDITRMPYGDAAFDLVLCSHVLEHVDDDRKAIAEIERVLRPGARAILMSPIDYSRPVTLEDPTISSPAERERVFGQADHVRLYGRDFPERVADAGFEVEVVPYLERVAEDVVERYGLRRDEDLFGEEVIYLCRKRR